MDTSMNVPTRSNQKLSVEEVSVSPNHNIIKRLQSELMFLMQSSVPGVSAFPVEDGNLLEWAGTIQGPQGTYYEGLTFRISINFPPSYPFKAPTIKFVSPMWHPNVDMSGNICLDILKEKWSAVYNVQAILLSLQSLLGEPNNRSPLNAQAAELWSTNSEEYKKLLMQRYREIE